VGTPITLTEPSAFSWLLTLLKTAVLPWLSLRYRNLICSGLLAD
jgi:hypothetical protein